MDRRRASFDWISTLDEGDAAAGAADIAGWLAEQPPGRDWHSVLASLRDALQRLVVHPRLRADPVVRDIFRTLGSSPSIEQISAAVGALARRVDDIVEPEADRAGAGRRLRVGL